MRRIVFVLLGLAAGVATALYVSARGELDARGVPAPPAPEDPSSSGGRAP